VAGIPHLNGLPLLLLVLFWTNGMSVIRSLQTGRVIGESNGASARNLLQPLCTRDVSESSVFAMFHLDYLSCFLTVLATILLARKSWTGLLIAIVNSLVVCAIGLRTSQLGFIPANLFCICVYGFSMRSWLKKQAHTHRDQAERRQDRGSVADGPRMSLAMPHRTAAGTATEGAQGSNRNAESHYPMGPELPNGSLS
jgi:hypothetical protein